MRTIIRFFAVLALTLCPIMVLNTGQAVAQSDASFAAYVQHLGELASKQGVRRTTIDAILPSLTYNQRAVALDRQQPGSSSTSAIPRFAPYRDTHVDASRIARGRTKYSELRPFLSTVERETGVPESVMVAIWGHETNYGAVRGNFDLPEALASLAYEGRRRDLFEAEFVAALKIIDRGIPRESIRGSWAGATGHPQFLPSMYLRLARDGDRDGRVDIWRSEADALASIANYFVAAGWRADLPWGVPVTVPASFDRSRVTAKTISPRCPRVHGRHSRWLTIAEWRALGLQPQRSLSDSVLASLIEPDGPGETAYLLTGNYRVILDYNCSNFYALSVGLLADAIAR